MNVIFAHDHRFIPADGGMWSESQFGAELWPRYLKHFDLLTVVAREGSVPAGRSIALERSSAPGVDFELVADLSDARGLTISRPAAYRRMRDIISRHDAVIARLPSEVGLLAIVAARDVGKPWAVEAVGCAWDALWNYGSLAGRMYAPLAFWRMRWALSQSDHAIYVTERFLQRRYPSPAANVATASNVDLPVVPGRVLQARLTRIGNSSLPVRLGLIGSLRGRYKGIQTLLAALASASGLVPFRLHILGGGDPAPWRAEAAQFGLADRVFFDGTLPAGPAVFNWLDQIDIYFQPSFQEGLPRALIEAMSRGCPAIASDVGGIPELLQPDEMIRPGDVRGLARLIKSRLGDHDWMASSARRNWEVSQRYAAERVEARRFRFWHRFSNEVRGAVAQSQMESRT